LGRSVPFVYVTIIPDEETKSGGRVQFLNEGITLSPYRFVKGRMEKIPDDVMKGKFAALYEKRIVVALAGLISQRLYFLPFDGDEKYGGCKTCHDSAETFKRKLSRWTVCENWVCGW
jgi:hypothetical protein